MGKFLWVTYRFLEVKALPELAEMKGIELAFELAAREHLRNFVVECDSKGVVRELNGEAPSTGPYA